MSTSVKDTHKVRNIVTVILSIILVLTLTPLAAHAKSTSEAVCSTGGVTYASHNGSFKVVKDSNTIILSKDTANGYANANSTAAAKATIGKGKSGLVAEQTHSSEWEKLHKRVGKVRII